MSYNPPFRCAAVPVVVLLVAPLVFLTPHVRVIGHYVLLEG